MPAEYSTRIGQPLGVANGEILTAAIGVMDQAASLRRATLADGLVQCIEHGERSARHRFERDREPWSWKSRHASPRSGERTHR